MGWVNLSQAPRLTIEKTVNGTKTCVQSCSCEKNLHTGNCRLKFIKNLSKIYFLKNPKKTSKPNNRDLNRDCKNKVKQLIYTTGC